MPTDLFASDGRHVLTVDRHRCREQPGDDEPRGPDRQHAAGTGARRADRRRRRLAVAQRVRGRLAQPRGERRPDRRGPLLAVPRGEPRRRPERLRGRDGPGSRHRVGARPPRRPAGRVAAQALARGRGRQRRPRTRGVGRRPAVRRRLAGAADQPVQRVRPDARPRAGERRHLGHRGRPGGGEAGGRGRLALAAHQAGGGRVQRDARRRDVAARPLRAARAGRRPRRQRTVDPDDGRRRAGPPGRSRSASPPGSPSAPRSGSAPATRRASCASGRSCG